MKIGIKLKLLLAHAATLILWASAFPVIRVGLHGYSPYHLSLLRMLIGSAFLIIPAMIFKIKLPERMDLPIILFMGAVGFGVYHVGLNIGERTVSSGVASVLVSTTPILTAILAVLLFKRKWGRWKAFGALISMAGIIILSLKGEGEVIGYGVWFILLASLGESIYFVIQHRFLEKYGVIPFTIYTIWAGTLCMLIFLPGLGSEIVQADAYSTVAVVYLGVFPTVIPYFALAYVTSHSGAAEATMPLFLTPVLSFLMGWALLGEVPTFVAIWGCVLTLAGVLLSCVKEQSVNQVFENGRL
ncbi:DMT family transporter [Rossellomorea marisflavi]|uniref:DMT family transporter n=1 Tax=Rossellomorea marisflavi TaxID=189381 RepID=UPI00204016C7|nr:EamA family transporter [Rossellomorea marisflavi]MCM2587979.1 DMT family transporter [Rossellomorea marisflavi]